MNRVTPKFARRVSLALFLTTFVILATAMSIVLPGIAAEDGETDVAKRADQLARSGKTEEAVQLLQAALAAHPEDLETRLALANIYARNRDGEAAEREFREALRLHPGSSSAGLALGAFYVSAGSIAPAEQVLNDVVQRHPELVPAHAQLALVLAMERKYPDA